MQIIKISFPIFFFFFSLSAETFDLEKVLNLAEENSKQLFLAQTEIGLAQARIKEAWADALPDVSAAISFNRNLKKQFVFVEGGFGPGADPNEVTKFSFQFDNEYAVNATLNQTLFSWKVGKALQIAYDYEEFIGLNYQYQKESILNNVKKAFYQALLTKFVFDVAKDSEESARQNYEQTKTRFESGVDSEYDLLQAEVRWLNAVPETLAANRDYQLALNNLRSAINLPLEKDLELEGDFEKIPPMPQNFTLNEVLQNREDYQAMIIEQSMREKNVSLQFAEHYPTLSGNFTYNYSGRSNELKLENDDDFYFIGLSLNIPIFNNGVGFTSAQVQKARIENRQAKTRISELKDNIQIELNNIYLRLKEANERIQAAQKNVSTATRAYEIAESRLKNGLSTQLELKDSRVFLDRARLNYFSARFDYLSAYFDWQIISGQWTKTF